MTKESTVQPVLPDLLPNTKRHILELSVGKLAVSVISARADCIASKERTVIREARYAYEKWGGNSKLEGLLEDPFDNFEPLLGHAKYLTYHFIATIYDAAKQDPKKTVTMRMIHTVHEDAQVPEDFTIWLIQNRLTASKVSLDQYIRQNPDVFRSRDTEDTFMYPAVISRLGTIDGNDAHTNPDRRILTPIAFAAIQLAAGKLCQSNFIAAQLRPELMQKYLSVPNTNGNRAMMGFTPTLETLGLDQSNKMVLDNNNPVVHGLKTHFPGYWLNETQFRKFIFRCVDEGIVPLTSFTPALKDLLENDSQRLSDETQKVIQQYVQGHLSSSDDDAVNVLLTAVTDARFARYLVPLLNSERVGVLAREEFQKRMMQQSGDGPYPVLMNVDNWVASARNVLQVAGEQLL